MIYKQISAMAITLALLLIVYSIATATNWQDQAQQLITNPTTQNIQPDESIAMTGPFAGHVTPSLAGQTSLGSDSVQKSAALSAANPMGDVQATPLEETINPTWLVGWIVQGIAALAALTGAVLGLFWLMQRARKA